MVKASYSFDDDKIRIESMGRLDSKVIEDLRLAGFRWAPRQKVWVAAWNPQRMKIAADLAEQVDEVSGDMAERNASRAEFMLGIAEHAAERAERYKDRTGKLMAVIPLGQPILVEHHSERKARKHSERIGTSITRALAEESRARYWTDRATAAKVSAARKDSAEVRERRIAQLEADWRRALRQGNSPWAEHFEKRIKHERNRLAEQTGKAPVSDKEKRTLPPLRNEKVDGAVEMTRQEYARMFKGYRGIVTAEDGSHRYRVAAIQGSQGSKLVRVFLTEKEEE
jgi:hypothetical protein